MGRPMGIPKTGIFGLYDLIGIDLMSDVVDTLGTILPDSDDFHKVGASNIPTAELIKKMIDEGFNFVTIGADQRAMSSGAKAIVDKMKGSLKKEESSTYW